MHVESHGGRPWVCLGSDQEIYEERLPVPGCGDARPLLKVHFSSRRSYFDGRKNRRNLDHKFAEEEYKEAHSREDPSYEKEGRRMENCMAVQAAPSYVSELTQTPHFRHVDSAIQAEPVLVDARYTSTLVEEMRNSSSSSTDPLPTSVHPFSSFVARVLPRMCHSLVLNTQLPLFADDFQELTDEDLMLGNRDDSNLREFGTFQHHRYTSGKMISAMDWQPKARGTVAVAIVPPVSCVERHRLAQKMLSNLVVVWNFSDPIHPYCLLESPVDISCLRFNPTSPNLIVGGGYNGQVLLWDTSFVSEVNQKTTKKNRNAHTTQESDPTYIPPMPDDTPGVSFDEDGDAKVMRIQPKLLSRLEAGHRRCVSDIAWLPEHLECNFEGKATPNVEDRTLQFATTSSDGLFLIWDIRPEHIRKDRLRKLQQLKRPGESLWIPLHKFTLTCRDGLDLMVSRFVLNGVINPYLLCCVTEEGEFALCNWCPEEDKVLAAQIAAMIPGDDPRGDAGGKSYVVKQCSPGHFGPAWSVQRHPSSDLSEYYLTTGDWGFKIWKLGITTPVVNWVGEHLITCGRWSPTRPAVVFLGTNEGVVQVWDLLDKSHEPTHLHPLMGEPVTALEFKTSNESRKSRLQPQLVAAGTRSGQLHILELPSVFSKAHTNEMRNMRMYLEREARRVQYYSWRWREVEKSKDADRNKEHSVGPTSEKSKRAETDGANADPEEDNEFRDEIKFNEAKLKFLELVHGPGLGMDVAMGQASSK